MTSPSTHAPVREAPETGSGFQFRPAAVPSPTVRNCVSSVQAETQTHSAGASLSMGDE